MGSEIQGDMQAPEVRDALKAESIRNQATHNGHVPLEPFTQQKAEDGC